MATRSFIHVLFAFAHTLNSAECVPRCTRSMLDWWIHDVPPGGRAFVVDATDLGARWYCLAKSGGATNAMMDPVVYSEANAGMFEQKSQMPCMFMRNEFRVTPELTNSSVNISLPGVVPSLCDTARRTSTTCSYPGAASGQTSWGGPSWKASACYASPCYASPSYASPTRET